MANRQITFVLPHFYDHPIGGYKVHFQYANAFAENGDLVTVLHPSTDGRFPNPAEQLEYVRARARQLARRPLITWVQNNPAVRHKLLPTLIGSKLPEADVTILTGWQTAERTRQPARQTGVLAQVVYDFEFWMDNPELRPRIKAALSRADVSYISSSRAVTGMLHEIGTEPYATVTAGIQDGDFGVDSEIEPRSPIVGFPLRCEPAKDMPTMFAATKLVRQAFPDVRIMCFGGQRGQTTPKGIETYGRLSHAELRHFYNQCSVFVLSSRFEGWGLTALEAMACGAAVVSTRNGGTEEFVDNGITGQLVPPGDPETLARAICRLLADPAERSRLGTDGAQAATAFTVSRSARKLDQVLQQLLLSA
jgi:L-malate glycosyltransferase